eukprot:scaffold35968_cov112-Isochrysis_galbana.AAC.1
MGGKCRRAAHAPRVSSLASTHRGSTGLGTYQRIDAVAWLLVVVCTRLLAGAEHTRRSLARLGEVECGAGGVVKYRAAVQLVHERAPPLRVVDERCLRLSVAVQVITELAGGSLVGPRALQDFGRLA